VNHCHISRQQFARLPWHEDQTIWAFAIASDQARWLLCGLDSSRSKLPADNIIERYSVVVIVTIIIILHQIHEKQTIAINVPGVCQSVM